MTVSALAHDPGDVVSGRPHQSWDAYFGALGAELNLH
jgi:hypothetical protein